MAEQEVVTMSWTKTTTEKFSDIKVDADTLRRIVTEHAPRLADQGMMLSNCLDWLNNAETEAVMSAIVAHLANVGTPLDGELDNVEFDDLEHDAEDLSEHFCEECEERNEDCTCCIDCGEAVCTCDDDDEDDEDEDEEDDEDDEDEDDDSSD